MLDINSIAGPRHHDFRAFLPKNMAPEVLREIAKKLCQWKQRELPDKDRLELETFAFSWANRVLELQKSPLLAKFKSPDYGYNLVVLAMAELEFLVHNEIVSREVQFDTYEPESAFEIRRLKHLSPDFLRAQLYVDGVGAIADGDLSAVMSSISKFLEQ